MILPDFILPSRANQQWQYSGIDSPDECSDKARFKSYPFSVEYCYNSRGFRDAEWPDSSDDLKKSIWCVGDSFTVGLGSPVGHTWPWQLQKNTGVRTINVSMDGASNQWIARKIATIANIIKPKLIIVQWSYVNRREAELEDILDLKWNKFYQDIKDSTWPVCSKYNNFLLLPENIKEEIFNIHTGFPIQVDDDERRIYVINTTATEDVDNTIECIQSVNNLGINIIHSFIPNYINSDSKNKFISKYTKLFGAGPLEVEQSDFARDGHHYDQLTAQTFVNRISQEFLQWAV